MLLRNATVRDFDRLTARVFDTATRTSGCRLDAYRDGDTYYIDIDLPGVDPADIDVTVDGTVLTVRAERNRAEARRPQPVVAERPMGTCTRQVLLSDTLDTDRLEARYDNGVLTLQHPGHRDRRPRRFEVTADPPDLPAAALTPFPAGELDVVEVEEIVGADRCAKVTKTVCTPVTGVMSVVCRMPVLPVHRCCWCTSMSPTGAADGESSRISKRPAAVVGHVGRDPRGPAGSRRGVAEVDLVEPQPVAVVDPADVLTAARVAGVLHLHTGLTGRALRL